jgi:hypothetical protein
MGGTPMVTRKSFTYRLKKGYDLPTLCLFKRAGHISRGGCNPSTKTTKPDGVSGTKGEARNDWTSFRASGAPSTTA